MNKTFKANLAGLLLMAATEVYAEELGRLFFTPKQRAQFEQSQQPGNTDNSLTVNGIVQKHGGNRTVWINGVPQPAEVGDERSPESARIVIPGQAKPVKLKVGQKVQFNPAGQ